MGGTRRGRKRTAWDKHADRYIALAASVLAGDASAAGDLVRRTDGAGSHTHAELVQHGAQVPHGEAELLELAKHLLVVRGRVIRVCKMLLTKEGELAPREMVQQAWRSLPYQPMSLVRLGFADAGALHTHVRAEMEAGAGVQAVNGQVLRDRVVAAAADVLREELSGASGAAAVAAAALGGVGAAGGGAATNFYNRVCARLHATVPLRSIGFANAAQLRKHVEAQLFLAPGGGSPGAGSSVGGNSSVGGSGVPSAGSTPTAGTVPTTPTSPHVHTPPAVAVPGQGRLEWLAEKGGMYALLPQWAPRLVAGLQHSVAMGAGGAAAGQVVYEVIDTEAGVDRLYRVLWSLPAQLIGMDAEGVNLGSEKGSMTLLQLAVGRCVFILDIQTLSELPDYPQLLWQVLGLLFAPASEQGWRLIPVFHDARHDKTALWKDVLRGAPAGWFDLNFRILDSQLLYCVLTQTKQRVSLNNAMLQYGFASNPFKDDVKKFYRDPKRQFWAQRPLTPLHLGYAAMDVAFLPDLVLAILGQFA